MRLFPHNISDINTFIHTSPTEKERRSFINIAPIYPFTTENIAGYFPSLDIRDKKVLTISGSGDHVMNAAFQGARSIDAFDINLLSKAFTEIKIEALKVLSFPEYLQYFILTPEHENVLSRDLYSVFCEHLSAETRYVFDKAYEAFNGQGNEIRNSHIFYNQPPVDHQAQEYNLYIRTAQNYLTTRSNLSNCSYRWYQSDLTELNRILQPSDIFDVILLSNIADYANRMYPGPDHLADFTNNILLPLTNHLSHDGLLCAACLFQVDFINPAHNENLLYDPEIRKQTFTATNLDYREIRFHGAISGHEDALIILRNTS